jgi:hypothetical protein
MHQRRRFSVFRLCFARGLNLFYICLPRGKTGVIIFGRVEDCLVGEVGTEGIDGRLIGEIGIGWETGWERYIPSR